MKKNKKGWDKKTKAQLIPLIKERAIRKYMVEKMRIRLSRMWQQNQTNNLMYKRTQWQYRRFEDKIYELDEAICNLVPTGTHFDQVRFEIIDSCV